MGRAHANSFKHRVTLFISLSSANSLNEDFVRPHLDYASQVWSPHQAYLSDMVEAVQHRATKLMVGNRIPYKERLNKTGLMSLSSRRIYLDLIFLFKCLHSYYDLDISKYLQFYDSEHEPYNLRNTELTF